MLLSGYLLRSLLRDKTRLILSNPTVVKMAAEESNSWEVCDSQKEKIKKLIQTQLKAGDTW